MGFYILITYLVVSIMVVHLLWSMFTRSPVSSRIKTLHGNIPLFGNILLFVNRSWFHGNKERWYRKYQDSFVVWFFTRRAIFTRDVSICEKLLTSTKYLSKGLEGYWVLEEWLGNGLILSEGDVWRKRRKIITPTFHFEILDEFVSIMEKQTCKLVDILRSYAAEGTLVNAFSVTKPYSMSIICETAMGIEVTQEESGADGRYDTWFNMIGQHMFKHIVYPWLWSKQISRCTKDGRQLCSALNNLQDFVKKIIDNRIESRRKEEGLKKEIFTSSSSKKKRIFIDTLLDAYEKGDIDVEGIQEEVNTFVNAGFETTSTALAWCLYCLGRNKEVQSKLHKELSDFHSASTNEGTTTTNTMTIQSLKALKYTECAIKESMRIHPPVPVIARTLTKDTRLSDEDVVPSGIVIVDIVSINRNPELWAEPMDFKPERFEKSALKDKADEQQRRLFSYIPFSAGPRNCIGQRFALTELKIALYYLIRHFEVTSTQEESELKETFDFFHGCENGLMLKFKSRQGS